MIRPRVQGHIAPSDPGRREQRVHPMTGLVVSKRRFKNWARGYIDMAHVLRVAREVASKGRVGALPLEKLLFLQNGEPAEGSTVDEVGGRHVGRPKACGKRRGALLGRGVDGSHPIKSAGHCVPRAVTQATAFCDGNV